MRKLSLLVILLGLLGAPVRAQAPAPEPPVSPKLAQIAQACQPFQQVKNVFIFSRPGKSQARWDAFATAVEGWVVLGTVLAKKGEYTPSVELYDLMLTANSHFDLIKVVIDDDGDLSVRCDLTERTLDAEQFKAALDQMVTAADEIRGRMKPGAP